MFVTVSARVRQILARSPWIYWAIVGAIALAVGLLVSQAASRVDAAREAWGETRPVLVAIVDIEPGQPLAGTTERRDVPSPLIPASALSELDRSVTARQRIAAGEIVVAHDVSPAAAPQALIPDGWLAVPVAERVASGVAPGDDVSVSSGGIVLAASAVVVGADSARVLVAVPADEAPQVAQAAITGEVSLLVQR